MARTDARAAAFVLAAGIALSGGASTALAGKADVVKAEATRSGDTWTFKVTVAHGDTGWDHYADSGMCSIRTATSWRPGPCIIRM